MATFGQGINPALGRIDYTPYMQGAMQGAQMQARGMEALGQGISQGLKEYYKNREEKQIIEGVTNNVSDFLEKHPDAAPQFGLKDPKDKKAINVIIKSAGGGDALTGAKTIQASLGQLDQMFTAKKAAEIDNRNFMLGVQTGKIPEGASPAVAQSVMKFLSDKAQMEKTAAETLSIGAPKPADPLKDALTQAQTDKLKAETAAIGAPKPVDTFGDESGLRKELQNHQSFKNYDIVKNFFERGVSVAKEDTAASDIALIFSYMKVLDPTSVVREGEYATAENAAGVPTRIRNAYEKALSGERLQPEQRQQYISAMRKSAKTQFEQIQPIVSQYKKIAEKRNLDATSILPDYYQSFNPMEETDSESNSAGPRLISVRPANQPGKK